MYVSCVYTVLSILLEYFTIPHIDLYDTNTIINLLLPLLQMRKLRQRS